MLAARGKIASGEILQPIFYKYTSTQCQANKCGRATAVQNSVIVSNTITKVTCIWMIINLMRKIMTAKVAQKMNNYVRYDIIICCINLVWPCLQFSLSLPPPPLHLKYVSLCLIFWSTDLQVPCGKILSTSLSSRYIELNWFH